MRTTRAGTVAVDAVDLQPRRRADAQLRRRLRARRWPRSSSRDRSTISSSRASTGTRSPGCTRRCAICPAIGALDRGIGARLARQLHAGQRGLQRGLCAGLGGHRVVQHGRRDEALRHQRLVVVQRALRRCRAARARPAPAARPGASRQSNSVVSSWASNWPARTLSPSRTATDLHLGRDARLDEGAVHRLQAARDLERARQFGRAHRRPGRSRASSSAAAAFGAAATCACWALRACQHAADARGHHGQRQQRQRQLDASASRRHAPRASGCTGPALAAQRQAVQHQVDLRVDERASGSCCGPSTGQAPSECLCSARKSIGAISECVASSTGTARNSPRSMPRCSVPEIRRCAGLDDLVGVELRQLGEVAHLGDDDLEDAAGRAVADALPPGVHQRRSSCALGAVEAGRRSAGPRRSAPTGCSRTTALNSSSLLGKYRYSVPLDTPARAATSSLRVAAEALLDEQLERRVRAVPAGALPCGAGGVGGWRTGSSMHLMTLGSVM